MNVSTKRVFKPPLQKFDEVISEMRRLETAFGKTEKLDVRFLVTVGGAVKEIKVSKPKPEKTEGAG